LVSGFAFFIEVAAVNVVYDRHREVFHLQTAKGFNQTLPSRIRNDYEARF
jgi:hypothetical protein